MDARLYGSLHGIWDDLTWVSDVTLKLQSYAHAIDKQWDVSSEMVKALARSYSEMVQEGKIAPLSFSKAPGDRPGEMGIPTTDTALAVAALSRKTGYSQMMVTLWANAFYLMYGKGRVPQKIFDPKTYESGKEALDKYDTNPIQQASGLIGRVATLAAIVAGVYVIGTVTKTVRVFKA